MGIIGTLKREAAYFGRVRHLLKLTDDLETDSKNLVADDFEAAVDKYASNIAFRFKGEITTYAEFDQYANQVANWALAEGLNAGDCVALFMENRVEYVAIWVGLAKVGVVTALINHNLEGEGLAHCINIGAAQHVITGAQQDKAIKSAKEHLEVDAQVWTLGGKTGKKFDKALDKVSTDRPDRSHRADLRAGDLCLYVYTSGTTGLPKAAKLTHMRTQGMMRSFIPGTQTTERDRVYLCLPLYHGTGGICGIGNAMMTGACVNLREKFSASAFWDDVYDDDATVLVYIGELCRYLLNQPPHEKENKHRVRTGFGNGLRPEIWQEFLDRFNIPRLCEFYGSTEGNVSFLNFDGKVGAVGRIPGWLEKKFDHVAFVKFDIESEAPVRGQDGYCIKADTDEAAEALGRIGTEARTKFEGYSDKKATEKKVLKNVFKDGDMWFRTGDLLRKDAQGYIYFVDRIGDTFRWKGENVATNQVSEVVSKVDGVETANVYGVPIPGTDGKAGMAALTTQGDVNFEGLYGHLSKALPSYAIPIFVRIQKQAETTGTFKYRKVELVEEGFNPEATSDPIWMLHPEKKEYVPLTHDRYETLLSGGFRF